ncbi:MAG: GAF domain-containing protein [Anaerolineales bacterium]|nr:GAF domain-containing protein [Anaerolineales bacterium]
MVAENNPRVLLVDGSYDGRCAIIEQLATQYQITEASSIHAASKILAESDHFDLLLTNHQLPDGDGLKLLDIALGYWPPVPVIFTIDEGGEAAAIKALQKGAADYTVKGSTPSLRLNQILANALARSQAEQSAQQRAREMALLNVVLMALNKKIEEEPVLDTIVQEVHALLGSDACSIFLVDKKNENLVLRASTRLPVHDKVWSVSLDDSISGRVIKNKMGEITHDVTRDPDWHSLNVDEMIPRPVASMLTVPLIAGGKAIGVLQAINKKIGPFLPSDLALMDSIAAIATAAIIRGRHYAQTQQALKRRAEQASEIERIVQAVQKQIDSVDALGASPLDSIRDHITQLIKLISD